MKAAVLGETGVELRDLATPVPASNEVLIRVRASSLNRADLLIAAGHQHGRVGGLGARLGLECAGEVAAVGSESQASRRATASWDRRPVATRNMP
jgi:NADPH2:quinone reductase